MVLVSQETKFYVSRNTTPFDAYSDVGLGSLHWHDIIPYTIDLID